MVWSLSSSIREILETSRQLVSEQGDAPAGCSWVEKSLPLLTGAMQDATLQEFGDAADRMKGVRVRGVLIQGIIHPYVFKLFDAEAQRYLLERCSEDGQLAGLLLAMFGDSLPAEVMVRCREVPAEVVAAYAKSEICAKYQRSI